MFKIITFVPLKDKEAVKNALFSAGAGTIGSYDHCCFESIGTGQFRPLGGSNPTLGKVGEVECVEEVRIELVCQVDRLDQALKCLKDAHPYETPAIDVIKLQNME